MEAAEDAAGVTAPRAGGDAEAKIMDKLTDEIALTRAKTIEGIKAKARFALMFLSRDVDFVELEILPGLVARSFNAPTALSASLIVDLVRLETSATDRSAA